MSKNGIRVEEFNIYMLGAEAVSYHLKNIHTLALQVTIEKIGGICLELETELMYNRDEPYFDIDAARGPKGDPEEDRRLRFEANDWIVILWDEIHKFRDSEFRSTFSFDDSSVPSEQIKSMDFAGALKGLVQHPPVEGDTVSMITKGEGPLYPDGDIDRELMEVRTSNWSGKKILMRVGTYDALADEAKKMFGPVEKLTTLAETHELELYENPNRETEEKLEGSEPTQIVPSVGTVGGNTREQQL